MGACGLIAFTAGCASIPAIAADNVLVMAHGEAGGLAQAESMLKALKPSHLELHPCGEPSVLSADSIGRLLGMLV